MSDVITLIASIVTTLTTVALAVLTWRYVTLTQQMVRSMESAREPFVDIELDLPTNEFRLAFVNAGGTTARNITFRVDQDCEQITVFPSREKGIASLHPIKNGISYLPAGQRLIYYVGHVPTNISSAGNPFLKITASYSDDNGRIFSRTIHYDLRQIDEVLFESFNNTHLAVAKAIREAQRDFSRTRNETNPFENFGKTQCPFCFEMISSKAKRCRHCHTWLWPPDTAEPNEKPTEKAPTPNSNEDRPTAVGERSV